MGDDASIRLGSFKETKHLCVLIHIRIMGEGVSVKHPVILADRFKAVLLLWIFL